MSRSFVVLPLLALFPACSVDPGTASPNCNRTSDCDLGFVCKQPEATCIAEPPDTFIGRFSCTVQTDTGVDSGEDDILGSVGGKRITLNGGALCRRFTAGTLDDLTVAAVSSVTVAGTDYLLNVVLPWNDASSRGGSFDLHLPLESNEEYTAGVVEYLNMDVVGFAGYSNGGRIVLDQQAEMDAPLGGYVEIPMIAPRENSVVGVPCPNGLSDCSSQPSQITGIVCLQPGPTDFWEAYCTSNCKTDSNCTKYGGICITAGTSSGICLRECQQDSDCDEAQVCADVNNETRRICFSDDPSTP